MCVKLPLLLASQLCAAYCFMSVCFVRDAGVLCLQQLLHAGEKERQEVDVAPPTTMGISGSEPSK